MRGKVFLLFPLLAACDAPFWVEHKREDARIAREEVVRAAQSEVWHAEETRRLLALCLDIAKFEKQWTNFAEWSFDPSTRTCTVSYKKPKDEIKTPKQCATKWLTGEGDRFGDVPSEAASQLTKSLYWDCVTETFDRSWDVHVGEPSSDLLRLFGKPTPTPE